MHGAHSYVVHEGGVDSVDLRGGVGGEAYEHVGADEGTDLRDRHVLLADVNTVGAALPCDEGTVVDHEQGTETLAQRPHGAGECQKLLVVNVLLA